MKLIKQADKISIRMSKCEWEKIGEQSGWIDKQSGWLKEGVYLEQHNPEFESFVMLNTPDKDIICNLAKIYEKIVNSCGITASMIKRIHGYLISKNIPNDEIQKEFSNMLFVSDNAKKCHNHKISQIRMNQV